MEETQKQQNKLIGFLLDILRGVAIGIAFIIPGFSGGSVAAILGIYEKLVGAIADFFKHFKSSFLILLPIVLGMLLGVAALILPIRWGLENFPIPTVSLFVGLALGGLPSITPKLKGEPPAKPSWKHFLACALSLAAAASLCFLPIGREVDLFHLNVGGYLLLVLIGIVGSAALVVPGISGSMLLLIFGYYNPVVRLITENLLHGQQVGICILVLFCLAVGLVVGFFRISMLMKFLLKKFPRGTYFAIVGFIVGSVPAAYVSVIRGSGNMLFSNPWYWVVSAVMLLVGFALSFALVLWSKKSQKGRGDGEE